MSKNTQQEISQTQETKNEQIAIDTLSLADLESIGFKLYQERENSLRIVNECNAQIQILNDELAKRNQTK
jgi:hypothetical protein